MIHPPMLDPTSTRGPSVARSSTSTASSDGAPQSSSAALFGTVGINYTATKPR